MTTSLYNRTTISGTGNPSVPTTRKYRGFSTVNKNSKNFALYDFELIKQDLLNSFYVRQGEKLMDPEYGCVIWDLLFEPLTAQVKDLLLQNINAIVNADPRIQASNVVITQYETGLQLEMTLSYVAYNLSENLRIHFDQKVGLLATSLKQ
jgi:phage baseplate assembly protein W